jgi:serine/threonine-protein kinase
MPGEDNIETILRSGQIVAAQYRVERLIAKGGMAAVWAGVNEHTGKRVALKVILHSFAANREVTELFRREAISASKVNHPNVVNIFDVIDHEGMTCIVMELLDGETMGSYLARNGALRLEETLALLLPAMRGVAAANAQGVVHRDLKPANIFLCSSPGGHLITTKVLDFGISVMIGRVGETAPATELLAMFGTPAYMAPEAIEFSPTIDGRADVYGFGVLFFEALAGQLPFIGPPGLDLLRRILTEEAPSVTLYRSDLPSEVVELIACALAKDPDDRFPDMAHLIQATEDRLLPLLPTPSSLTAISDIFLQTPSESNPGASIPVEKVLLAKVPLGPASLRSTRALYSMTGETWRTTNGAGLSRLAPRSNRPPATAVPRARPRRPAIAHSFRRFNRQAAIGAAMVVFVVGVVWTAMPSSSSGRGVEPGLSSHRQEIAATAPRARVTWLPDSPSPTVAADVIEEVSDTAAPVLRMAAPRSSRHEYRERSRMHRPHMATFPDQPSAPTAGRLTQSDF